MERRWVVNDTQECHECRQISLHRYLSDHGSSAVRKDERSKVRTSLMDGSPASNFSAIGSTPTYLP